MSKPTKFDLMRAGRERAEWMRREPSILDNFFDMPDTIHVAKPHRYVVSSAKADTPPYRTMEIDGMKYREAPEIPGKPSPCFGCAFHGSEDADHECAKVDEAARKAFGGNCVNRDIIYIRAT